MAPPRTRRPGFSRRAQYSLFAGYVIAVAGTIVAAGLLALSSFDPIAFRAMRAGVAEVTTPVSTAAAAVVRGLAAGPQWLGDHIAVGDRNVRLEKELRDMRAMITRARTLSYENRRLRALLRVRDGIVQPIVVARLVNSSMSSTRRYATLNAGSMQGVEPGQPVRGPDGLIGQIVGAGPNSARVLLLADPESIVPVRRTRDGIAAFAGGRGDGVVELRSAMGPMITFRAGDVFVTSGTGGIFPPGIPVARVVANARDVAVARTFAQPGTFDYALVQRAFVQATPPPLPEPAQP